MQRNCYLPHLSLRSLVFGYETISFTNKDPLPNKLFFLPNLDQAMLFCFYSGQAVNLKTGDDQQQPLGTDQLLAGVIRPSRISNIQRTSAIRVHFRPGALSTLYGTSFSTCAGRSLSLGESLDPELTKLYQQMQDTSELTYRLKAMENHLLSKAKDTRHHQLLYSALDQHYQTAGYGLSLAQISRKIGLSERNLHRKLKQQMGISPCKFRAIHRFNTSINLLSNNKNTSLTQLAYQLDYSDQAHFTREFKRWSGMTPSSFKQQLTNKKLTSVTAGGRGYLERAA